MSAKNKQLNIASMTKIALLTALLCVSSYFVIPLPFTPSVLSMHTIMVNIIGLILKPSEAIYTILIYLLMGVIGIPVFSGGSAGVGKLFGATGGFYFGFLFAVMAISLCKGKKRRLFRYIVVTVGLGLPIQHICAVLFMCFHNGFQVKSAIITISLPFLFGDMIKCIMASILGVKMNQVLSNQ